MEERMAETGSHSLGWDVEAMTFSLPSVRFPLRVEHVSSSSHIF